MRTTIAMLIASLAFAGTTFAACDCGCGCGGSTVAPTPMKTSDNSRDGFFLRDGRVMTFQDGNATELTQEMALDNGTRLEPDGTLIMADGTRSRIRDSQWMGRDGRFFDRERVNAGMTTTNTRDGFFLQNGKVMSFRNGNVSEINSEVKLENGARLQADGTLIMSDGTRSKINNGQWVSTDGRAIERNRDGNRQPQDVSNDRFNNNATNNNFNNTNNNTNENFRQNDKNGNSNGGGRPDELNQKSNQRTNTIPESTPQQRDVNGNNNGGGRPDDLNKKSSNTPETNNATPTKPQTDQNGNTNGGGRPDDLNKK